MNSVLQHHGIKGMRWGVRRFQNRDGTLTDAGKDRYSEESNKTIRQNNDGSKTIPKGFMFNRVGKSMLDVNSSGALYVSYGKQDAARYVKALGPTPIAKLLGTAGEAVQHISVKQHLKLSSNEQTAMEVAKLLSSNEKLFNRFKESIFSITVTGDWEKELSKVDIEKAMKNPSGKEGQKLSYGVSSFLADPNYINESKLVYEHFKKAGFDAIPDVHDQLSGTSETAMIIINPEKVEIKSTTLITKDVMRSAKEYVKSIEKLKVSDLIK